MNVLRRVLGVPGAIGVLALGLSGCTSSDAFSARLFDAELVFAFCQSVQAGQIQALVGIEDGDPSSYKLIWESEGEGQFVEGDEIVLGQDPEGFETSVPFTGLPENQSDNTRIVVFVSDSDVQDSAVGGIGANYRVDQLSTDYWLHEGGRRTSAACG